MTPAKVASVAVNAASIALATAAGLGAGAEEPDPSPLFLQQSWSPADRAWFYSASQGSQIMPYAWFMSLERPDNRDLFVSDGLARFGYVPNPYDGAGEGPAPVSPSASPRMSTTAASGSV